MYDWMFAFSAKPKIAVSSMVFASSALGDVPIVQETTIPSKQSTTGDRYTFPAGIPNSVISVNHFTFDASQQYEHGSIILTSSKYFSGWGELLSDNVLATALLDRLLHHAHVLNIRGETYRLKDRRKTGVVTVPPALIPADR